MKHKEMDTPQRVAGHTECLVKMVQKTIPTVTVPAVGWPQLGHSCNLRIYVHVQFRAV